MSELIAPNSLKDLVDAHAIGHATVVADQGSFKIAVKYGMVERTVSVRTRNGHQGARIYLARCGCPLPAQQGAPRTLRRRCVAF
jgi:hypothetical protein